MSTKKFHLPKSRRTELLAGSPPNKAQYEREMKFIQKMKAKGRMSIARNTPTTSPRADEEEEGGGGEEKDSSQHLGTPEIPPTPTPSTSTGKRRRAHDTDDSSSDYSPCRAKAARLRAASAAPKLQRQSQPQQQRRQRVGTRAGKSESTPQVEVEVRQRASTPYHLSQALLVNRIKALDEQIHKVDQEQEKLGAAVRDAGYDADFMTISRLQEVNARYARLLTVRATLNLDGGNPLPGGQTGPPGQRLSQAGFSSVKAIKMEHVSE